jgi:hypothetical protein
VVRRALTGHVTEEMQRGVLNLMPAREILTINDEKPKVDLQVVGGGSALRLLRFAGSGQGERKAPNWPCFRGNIGRPSGAG